MENSIKEKAHDKAFSQIHSIQLKLRQLEYDVERKNVGALTLEHLELCLEATKRELKTWSYILKLIELDYGKNSYVDEILRDQRDYDTATAG